MSHTRKVQKVGGGTYTVSIPKSWANDRGLEAGNEVTLYPHADGSLVVSATPTDGDKLADTTVEVSDECTSTVERALAAAYAAGFQNVRFTGDALTSEQRRAARHVAREHAGVEIVEESAHRVVVRTVLDASGISIPQSLTQISFAALSMHRAATTALTETDGSARRVVDRTSEIHRRVALVRRHLSRTLVDIGEADSLDVGRPALFEHYCAARQLERVADHAMRLHSFAEAGEVPEACTGQIRTVATDARSVVEDATDVLLGGSPAQVAHDALDRRDQVRRDVADAERTLGERSDETRALRALDCLARTADAGADIAETALRATRRANAERNSADGSPPQST